MSLGVKSKNVVAAAMLAVRFCDAGGCEFGDQTFRNGRDLVKFDGFAAGFRSLIPDWKREREPRIYTRVIGIEGCCRGLIWSDWQAEASRLFVCSCVIDDWKRCRAEVSFRLL